MRHHVYDHIPMMTSQMCMTTYDMYNMYNMHMYMHMWHMMHDDCSWSTASACHIWQLAAAEDLTGGTVLRALCGT